MATKNIKSAGKLINGQTEAYWLSAAKMIEWPVDLAEKHISVPPDEIDRAINNLTVQHFTNNGFFIQQCIPEHKTKVFNPEPLAGKPLFPDYKKEIVTEDDKYKKGDRFEIKSTGCELEVTFVSKEEIRLNYTNMASKAPVVSNEKQITKSLNLGAWKRI